MRTAVIRVNLDPAGDLAADRLARAVQALRGSGIEVLAPDFGQVPAHAREIELLVEGDDPPALRAWAEARCAEALDSGALDSGAPGSGALGSGARGAPGPRAGAATFLSRGTDEDALGVVRAFGISAGLDRFWEDDEEIAVFTITRDDATHVAESRLRTALEAALNCEVRIVIDGSSPDAGAPLPGTGAPVPGNVPGNGGI